MSDLTVLTNKVSMTINELTMSSRDIAILTGKKHYHVKRDIELLASQLEVDVSKFGSIYTDSQYREQTEYLLDIETCLCLVAGYNAKLRMKIIKRWQEETLKAYVAEIGAHELTKTHLTHEEELAKKKIILSLTPLRWLRSNIYEIDLNLIFKD